jgi:hypothetical protein
VICLDDSSFAKGKEIQQKAMGALQGYGSAWVFKSISSTPSVDEVNTLFGGTIETKLSIHFLRNRVRSCLGICC